MLWVGWFFFPNGLPVLLNTRGLTSQHYCITFPLCRVHPRVSVYAHRGMCAVHDLFGQCILRSGSECPSSHCVGVHVSVYCISLLFCPDWLICKNIFLLELSCCSLACYSLVYLSQGEQELLIQLSSGALVHLWKACNNCVWSGSLCFVLFNHVRPYWIYK